MKSIGDRITYCRSTIGLTRKEFSLSWGEASVPTLARWELDVIEPTPKKISSVAEFFCSKGLVVSPDWIQSGTGFSPSHLNMKEFTEDDFDEMCDQSFLNLNQKIKNFTYYKVTTNFFAPVIRYGDYVGGVKLDGNLSEHVNSLVFIVHDNAVHVGFLDDSPVVAVKNAQGKLIEFTQYSLLAKVNWTAIRP